VFYKQTQSDELTRAQMEAARRAFRGKLLRLRYSPQFIVNNSDELLAIAHSEYARAVAKGVEIEDPVAWTIHCAWRRTQNLLQAESVRPRSVSSEQVAELVDDGGNDLEEQALEQDRARKIREAVAKLDDDQRKVIALTFFEDMSVREAARHLGCSASSVQHRRETALRTLRRFLPVRSGDELVVDIGMAAWLAIAADRSGIHLPAGFEAVIDKAGHGATGLWGRVQDLARRFGGGGGEAASAVASSGAGRAAGVCATGLAVVCIGAGTSGLVGPGIGAIGGGDQHSSSPPSPHRLAPKPRKQRAKRDLPDVGSPKTTQTVSTEPATWPPDTKTSASTSSSSEPSPKSQTAKKPEVSETPVAAKASVHQEEVAQVEEETSGIARAGAESTTTAAPPVAVASDEGASPPTVVHAGQSSPSPSSEAAVDEEFNFEK
jgi:RNA polymerase sigma factor (sigma-70 family)